MLHSKKQGFTLVEVLIVISIIALLAGITITAIGPARKKGRDAQRVSDLANIRIALALYKSANVTYPNITISGSPTLAINNTGVSSYQAGWDKLKTDLAPYISLPTDPLDSGTGAPWSTGTNNYHYAYIATSSPYDLVARFEDTNNPNRCQLKDWKIHRYSDTPWCQAWGGTGSNYLYADH